MIRRPPRSTQGVSSAASDVYKRQVSTQSTWGQFKMRTTMKKPRQVEVNEAEKKAIKDSHKFAKAVTQPKKMTGTGMSTIPKQKEEKAASKKQPNAGRTKEMDEVLNEIAGVKMLNENMGAKTSTRAKEMFEKMKETRRAKHVDTMNEYEEWLETFGDSMKERYEDRKKQTESLISTSSMEINKTLSSMTDEILLTSKIEYVTQSWDHISNIRKERKKEISSLAEMLNELHRVKSNSIMEYLTTFKDKLVDIAFFYWNPKLRQWSKRWFLNSKFCQKKKKLI
eukprot:TRINITY_DN3679_c0_g1_i1.p1 TRINITY_DN3679_c0_g1~~TRINITY_DN3679_c0_g1_i1.p1  ORF type:complete len:282 (-),score=52.65 TRINITY_DN3679_c0_g1_i1:198-1043(-)